MQLKKQSIRKTPTFHEITFPNGIHRRDADSNQDNNQQQDRPQRASLPKRFVDPLKIMKRDADFHAITPPQDLPKAPASYQEAFRASQRRNFAAWRFAA